MNHLLPFPKPPESPTEIFYEEAFKIALIRARVYCEKDFPCMLDFDLHGDTAGLAWNTPKLYKIQLNWWHCRTQTTDAMLNTLCHELAHIICFVKNAPNEKHGFLWQRSMVEAFGEFPTQYHDMETIPAAQSKAKKRIAESGIVIDLGV